MNALATKPRASKKALPATTPLQGAINKWHRIDKLLSQAWDASDSGSDLDQVLMHVIERLLPDPMVRLEKPGLTKKAAEKIYNDLFAPIAVLTATAYMVAGEIHEHNVEDACRLLNELQRELAEQVYSTLPDAAPPEDTTADAFMKGKALACAMFSQVDKFNDGGYASICSSYRSGVPGSFVPQENFTAPYLQRLVEEPALVEGFGAGLCEMLIVGVERGLQVEEFVARVTYEDARAPVLDAPPEEMSRLSAPPLAEQIAQYGFGALASKVDEREHPLWGKPAAAQCAATAAPAISNPEHFDADDHPVTRAWCRVAEARAVIKSREEHVRPGDNLVPGVRRLAKVAEEILERLHSSQGAPQAGEDELNAAACVITETSALLSLINSGADDMALHGAEALLSLAQSHIQEALHDLMAKERAK